jgi:hypothetical protein
MDDPLLENLRHQNEQSLHDALTRPEGFEFGATPAGIQASGRKDLGHDVAIGGTVTKGYTRRAWDWFVGVTWTPAKK